MHEAHPGFCRSPSAASPQPWSPRQATLRQHPPPGPHRGQHQRRPGPTPRSTPASAPARAWSSGTPCWTPNGASHVRFDRTYQRPRGRRRRLRRPPGRGRLVPLGLRPHPRAVPAPRPPPRSRPQAATAKAAAVVDFAKTPRDARPGGPRRAPRPHARLARRRHRPQRRRLPRRRVRLRRRPQRQGPRPLGLRPRGHRLRHRRVVDGTVSLDTTLSGATVHDGRPGTRGGNATYNGPLSNGSHPALHRRRQRLGQRLHQRPAVRRRRRPLRHRQDLGLLQEHLRPQRHRQRRQGRPLLRPRRRLRQRLVERLLLLHALRRRRRHDVPAGRARRGRPRDEPRRHQPHRRPDLPRRVAAASTRPTPTSSAPWSSGTPTTPTTCPTTSSARRSTAATTRRPTTSAAWTSRPWTAPARTAGAPPPSGSTCTTPPARRTTTSTCCPRAAARRRINGIAYNSPTCNGTTVTGIGRDAAAAIWYRALTVYMTSSTNYAGARVANVNAATDLYGASSTQVAARQGRLVGGVGELITSLEPASTGRALEPRRPVLGDRPPFGVPGRRPAAYTSTAKLPAGRIRLTTSGH